jgi:pyruvate dehydrogenase E1 component beta subunit
MAATVAETIKRITREHLRERNGILFGQCVTAVGWIGGTVPEMTEDEGICELSMADVAGAGIAVGAALTGRRPIYVIRYQGFMWYNAAPILNYAAKSKQMWDVPCPLFVRALAMEGGMGPVASGAHHSMVMRMPGIPICSPMTPGEWQAAWDHFMSHDDPIYVSEHRRSFSIDYEMESEIGDKPAITIVAASAGRLNARDAVKKLAAEGIACDLIHAFWLKPFQVSAEMRASLARSGLGLVIDSDFEIAGAARSLAFDLMHASGKMVHALGLEDRTGGFAPHLDNPTPPVDKIVRVVKALVAGASQR